jgi:tRNA uridine 5-carboxymethylaminomethyl modification enzyme
LREVEGFESLEIFRPGYAIEYDYFPPTQLYHTLETKLVENLYFAGQVNGTTGYEEAAAQGLVAGVNANLKLNKKEPFVLRRDQAYIGVLVDDLVTKGVDEPYRMFTSRAEYRILLRQDNADARLTELSYTLGLASRERYDITKVKRQEVAALLDLIEKESIAPSIADPYLESIGSAPLRQQRKLKELLLRPEVSIEAVANIFPPLQGFLSKLASSQTELIEEADILMSYSGYIERERMQADKLARLEKIKIPDSFSYAKLNITIEAQQKLTKIKPKTIGQASRIPGVSPADISVLLVFLGR